MNILYVHLQRCNAATANGGDKIMSWVHNAAESKPEAEVCESFCYESCSLLDVSLCSSLRQPVYLLNFKGSGSSSSSRRSRGISQAVSVWQHVNNLTPCSFRFTYSSEWRSRALSWLLLWSGRMFVSYETKRMWDINMTVWPFQLLSWSPVPNRTSGKWRRTQRSLVETWMSCRTPTG